MKKLFTIIICIISIQVGFADSFIEDNTDVIGVPEISYDNLSPQYLKFNCLRDRGAEFVDFDLFTGKSLNDSNYCDRYIFADIARSVRSMLGSRPSWNSEEMLATQDELGDIENAVIGIIHYQYLYIKENALRDNLIRFENGNVYDNYIDGVHQDPYDTGSVLAFSAQDSVFNNIVTFSFPSSICQRNYGGAFYFDAGDGTGYRQINLNDKITVNYSTGEHELKLKVVIGAATLEAHSKIHTIDTSETQSRGYGNYFMSEIIKTEYGGKTIRAKLSRYKYGHNKQPFIYVEGFDTDMLGNSGKKDNMDGYGLQGAGTIIGGKFLSEDVFSSYDFYYLDFEDGTASNKAKAELLKNAIQRVNANKTTSSKNIVFGSSMGGITARYCLSKMEEDGLKHQTSILVCQDTPNLGANVPLGALYVVREGIRLFNRGSSEKHKDKLGDLQKVLDSEAAKEMLYNYVTPDGIIDNSVHDGFYSELQALGYPHGDDGLMRCIAISNGNEQITQPNECLLNFDVSGGLKTFYDAVLNLYSPLLGPAAFLITKDLFTSLLAMVPGRSRLTFSCEIYPTGSTRNICEMKLMFKKKVLWLANVKSTLYKFTKAAPKSGINFDITKGSYFDTDVQFDINKVINLNKLVKKLIDAGGKYSITKRILFIPTASALDIGAGTTSLVQADYDAFYSMQNRPLKPKHSPFHAYYISSNSEQHILFNSDMSNWLKSQLATFVYGHPIATTGSKYVLNNNVNNSPITWSTSDESIATIDNTGVITAKEHGFVTVLATLSTGEVYPKRIMVGLPQYIISTYYNTDNIVLEAQPLSQYAKYKDYSDLIKFQFSEGTPISWKSVEDKKYTVMLSSTGNQKTIYMRPYYMSDDDIVYGPVSYIAINTALPYTIEPNYFAHRGGNLTSIVVKQNPYYIGSIPNDFKICNVDCKGTTTSNLINLNSVTTITLNANNVFPSGMIDWFLKGPNQSITESFTIRGKKGNMIQTFNVPLIKQ